MSKQAGYQFKIRINGAIYSAQNVEVDDAVGEQDVTESEDNGNHQPLDGKRRMQIRVTKATYDPAANPFTGAASVSVRKTVAIVYYIDGVGGDNWDLPSALVIQTTQRGEVAGLQPVSFTAVGSGQLFSDPGGN